MILTDREISSAIETRKIIIDPVPTSDRFSSTAVDFTLAARVSIWKSNENLTITPRNGGYNYADLAKTMHQPVTVPEYRLQPGQLVLGWTEEQIELPRHSGIAGRVEGKSSLARLGIGIHVTAPTIHAGFRGQIQLEIINHGPYAIEVVPGMRICQLIFEMTFGTPQMGYAGGFRDQRPS